MRLIKVVLSVLIFTTCSWAENRFIRPGPPGPDNDFQGNAVHELGDKINLQWKTDLASVNILLWQFTGDDRGRSSQIAKEMKATEFTWAVSYAGFPADFNPSYSSVFNVAMYRSGDTSYSARSKYFNISAPASSTASASTPILPTPTSNSKEATTATTTTTSAPTPNPNTVSVANSSEGSFSGGAVAAIAIGAVLGVLVVVGVVGWLVWRNLRGKTADGGHPSEQVTFVGAQEKPGPRPESTPQLQSEPLLVQDPGQLRHELAAEPCSRNNEV
ncbi:hypothetical protein LZ30DRAFT_460575 [Colletotrichum cereale]|nr:hypothetical protein LZ30DRAFT_460575 [Colletotrichum cereale]